jgi:hypothetical protein
MKMNMMYIKRRLDETEKEIKLIQKDSQSSVDHLSSIQNELDKFTKEEKDFRDKLFCLNIKGAVFYPSGLLSLSIILAASAQLFPQGYGLWLILVLLSSIKTLAGIYRIYCTLRSVDFAATNVPLPDFDVAFDNEEKTWNQKENTRFNLQCW